MTAEPFGKTVQSGVYDPLCDIQMVQHVTDPPPQFFFDNVADRQPGMFTEKILNVRHFVGNDRKEGILVDNAGIQ